MLIKAEKTPQAQHAEYLTLGPLNKLFSLFMLILVNSLAQSGSPMGTGLEMEVQVSSWHLAVKAVPKASQQEGDKKAFSS